MSLIVLVVINFIIISISYLSFLFSDRMIKSTLREIASYGKKEYLKAAIDKKIIDIENIYNFTFLFDPIIFDTEETITEMLEIDILNNLIKEEKKEKAKDNDQKNIFKLLYIVSPEAAKAFFSIILITFFLHVKKKYKWMFLYPKFTITYTRFMKKAEFETKAVVDNFPVEEILNPKKIRKTKIKKVYSAPKNQYTLKGIWAKEAIDIDRDEAFSMISSNNSLKHRPITASFILF